MPGSLSTVGEMQNTNLITPNLSIFAIDKSSQIPTGSSVVTLPTGFTISNFIIQGEETLILSSPVSIGGSLQINSEQSQERPSTSLTATQPVEQTKENLPDNAYELNTVVPVSPEVDPDKMIMDLAKPSEWADISSVNEIVVSPQLDILELQWNEMMNKEQPDNNSSDSNLNLSNKVESSSVQGKSLIKSSTSNTNPATALYGTKSLNNPWLSAENNNLILEDAMDLLGRNYTDSGDTRSEEVLVGKTTTQIPSSSREQEKVEAATSTGKCCTSKKNQREDSSESCKCKSPGAVDKDCCVTVCLKTLNQLRKVLERGCCKSTNLANNSLASLALQMASAANCCPGD